MQLKHVSFQNDFATLKGQFDISTVKCNSNNIHLSTLCKILHIRKDNIKQNIKKIANSASTRENLDCMVK